MPNFVQANMFIFILGFGPICDEFRIWASNFVSFYFIESSSRFVLAVYFVFISYFIFICH